MLYLILEYARQVRRGIELNLSERLILPTLMLLYSGMDVLGSLAAPSGRGGQQTFTDWTSRYMTGFLDKKGLSATDLYSARCGILHTGRATSDMVDGGNARELWYRLGDDSHINLIVNTPVPPVEIDIVEMARAFSAGIDQFLSAVQTDSALGQIAVQNSERFFRKGKLFGSVFRTSQGQP
jgi:hypothetical protein